MHLEVAAKGERREPVVCTLASAEEDVPGIQPEAVVAATGEGILLAILVEALDGGVCARLSIQ